MFRTRGPMLQFDHRGPATRFYAKASPINTGGSHYQQKRISVRIDGGCVLQMGEVIDCIGWFRESENTNPQHTLYVPTNKVVENASTAKTSPLDVFRRTVRSSLLSGIRNPQYVLANALFFGIRGEGWSEISLQFRRAGMSHILAISGLHVGLLVLMLLQTMHKIGIGRLPTTLCVLAVVGGVLVLIEARSPAIRAAIMLCIIFMVRNGGSRCNTVGLLGVSALVMLVLFPRDAATVGFQLSFIVVTSLCVLLPHIKWRLIGPESVYGSTTTSAWRWIASIWITGLCAWTVSSPITAHVFGTISPSGLLTNVPAIGLLVLSLVAGIARLCVGWLGASVDQAAGEQLLWTLSGFLFIAKKAGELPLSHIQGIPLTWCWSAIFLTWVVWWAIAIRKRWRIWIVLLLILLGTTVGPQTISRKVVITTIEVGHGTCHIVQHGTYTMMIDGGSKQNLDVGTNTLLPAIRELGITIIETIVVTHSDLDHIAGVVDVLNSVHVSSILVAKQAVQHQTRAMGLVLQRALELGIPVIEGSAGWEESLGDLRVMMLSPNNDEPYRSSNAAAIVLMLRAHGRSVLFTGDIDEQKVVEIGKKVQSPIDVIELPHHGQWSSESQELINRLHPPIIIQSTNVSRHAKDKWSIPPQSSRFVTAVDGTLTTTIFPGGTMTTTGSRHPASMATCCVSN